MKKEIIVKVGVLVEYRGKLLLIKEISPLDGQYRWNIIKGTYEPGRDVSMLKAAERESMEEAGVSIKSIQFLNVIELEKERKTILQFNFLAKSATDRVRLAENRSQKKRNEDIVEARFFDKKEVRKMNWRDFLNQRAYQATRDWLSREKEPFRLIF